MPSGAAGVGSKSSLKGRHEDQRRALEWADVRAPRGRAKAKRWSLSARTGHNFHCGLHPPASGSRRCDAGRDLLRTDAVAPVRDPASSRQAGRRPDGFTVPRRVPRCGTATASSGSKSSLKEGHPEENVGRRVRSRRHRNRRGAGLCRDQSRRSGYEATGLCARGRPQSTFRPATYYRRVSLTRPKGTGLPFCTLSMCHAHESLPLS